MEATGLAAHGEDGVWPQVCNKRAGGQEGEGLGNRKCTGRENWGEAWIGEGLSPRRGFHQFWTNPAGPQAGIRPGRGPFEALYPSCPPQPRREGRQGITCPAGGGQGRQDRSHSFGETQLPSACTPVLWVCATGMPAVSLAEGLGITEQGLPRAQCCHSPTTTTPHPPHPPAAN